MISLLVSLMIGGALALASWVAFAVAQEWRWRRRAMRAVRTLGSSETAPHVHEGRSFSERVIVPGLHRLGTVGRRLVPLGSAQRISRELAWAGNPPGWDAERVLAAKLLGGAGGGIAAAAIGAVGEGAAPRRIVFTVLCAATGYFLPDWAVRVKARRRQDEIRRALPDTLDLLAISVEAGLGFDAAVARVVTRTDGALTDELNRMLREIQLGRSRRHALRDLGERSDVAELRSFCAAMVQGDAFGVSVSKVLQVQAHEMRIKRRQRAEERAQKVPVKIVFPVLVCIFPALFVVLLGPGAINIYRALFRG